MKGLKIIPVFLILIVLSYFGVSFVDANRTEVVLHIFHRDTPPGALGFVVLTSVLFGMLISGAFCSIEMLALYFQNRRLKRKLHNQQLASPTRTGPALDSEIGPRPSGRFT